ncbi:MAG: DUF4157 domain-containing protein [Acidobacteriota bacterium]|nr:DUF4157 domain-containing protein [Acidobacteriota bacterium]
MQERVRTFEGEADRAATARTRSAVRPLGDARHAAVLPAVIQDGVVSRGEKLDASVRDELEPRLGHDFGRVRVHSDPSAQRSARALNAHAYTAGTDIVFGSGEYAPQTPKGRELIAHELTHVKQQASGAMAPTVQAKLKSSIYPLDTYLLSRGAGDYSLAGTDYSHPGLSTPDLSMQILVDLLHSPRVFFPKGATQQETESNLDAQVAARQGVVEFAAKKQYKFAAGAKVKMNPKYWNVGSTGKESVKPGMNVMEALKDVNVNPQEYAIACQLATNITLSAGSGGSASTKDFSVAPDDWIPGEAGYILNTMFTGSAADVGYEGENLIYTSAGMFWGHFATVQAYKTLDEWFKTVEGWNGGAMTMDHRLRPARGLL